MPEKDRFPLRYGRGHSKVAIYNRTTAVNRPVLLDARYTLKANYCQPSKFSHPYKAKKLPKDATKKSFRRNAVLCDRSSHPTD